ncbi:MAG TPA: DinB family protein [Gemmatimonadaceae bacterium]|nr:DinB family protein [Gemmatimonadaceae bacterium]
MPAPATELNPYAKFLGDARPHDVLDMTAVTIARLIRHGDAASLTRSPEPGKWSIRDILCHLADCEITFGFRLRQTAAEKHHVIQPFDQDAWASAFAKLDAHDALEAFSSLRRWNMLFIRAVGTPAEAKEVRHPERGDMTFRTIVETMAGHDINHLRQIENLV